jgi:hypothetical protein
MCGTYGKVHLGLQAEYTLLGIDTADNWKCLTTFGSSLLEQISALSAQLFMRYMRRSVYGRM